MKPVNIFVGFEVLTAVAMKTVCVNWMIDILQEPLALKTDCRTEFLRPSVH
jgi:hypothetical protein